MELIKYLKNIKEEIPEGLIIHPEIGNRYVFNMGYNKGIEKAISKIQICQREILREIQALIEGYWDKLKSFLRDKGSCLNEDMCEDYGMWEAKIKCFINKIKLLKLIRDTIINQYLGDKNVGKKD